MRWSAYPLSLSLPLLLPYPFRKCLYEQVVDLVLILPLSTITRYADGGTLAQFLAKRKGRLLRDATVRALFRGVCSAIEYIHAQRILHRDLKSENVFLMLSGVVKVGDFGIAKQLSVSTKGGRAMANTLLGTPHIISPELCKGEDYDEKSDIWSLGCRCLLYPTFVCGDHELQKMTLPCFNARHVLNSYRAVVFVTMNDGQKLMNDGQKLRCLMATNCA